MLSRPGRNPKSLFRRLLFLLFILSLSPIYPFRRLLFLLFIQVFLLALYILPSFMMEKGPTGVIYSIILYDNSTNDRSRG